MKNHNLCCHPLRNATVTVAVVTLLKQYIFRGRFVALKIALLFTSNNRLLVKDKAYNTFDMRYSSLVQQKSQRGELSSFLACLLRTEREINRYINCRINQLTFNLSLDFSSWIDTKTQFVKQNIKSNIKMKKNICIIYFFLCIYIYNPFAFSFYSF